VPPKPDSEIRRAASRLPDAPIAEDRVFLRRPVDPRSSVSPPSLAGTASFRRQIAALQKDLSLARAELGSEQEGRANEAEQMETLLGRLASEEAVTQALREDLARERTLIEDLRETVQEKVAECGELRRRVSDVEEIQTAKELTDATERHVQTQRADRAEAELVEVRQSAERQAVEAEARLEDLRKQLAALQAELEKAAQGTKAANLKAFGAAKQLDAWKSESTRLIEQGRAEHAAAQAKLAADYAASFESLRRAAIEGVAASVKSLQAIQSKLSTAPTATPSPLPLGSRAPRPSLPAAPPRAAAGPPPLPPDGSSPTATARPEAPRDSAPSLEVAVVDCPEELVDENKPTDDP
jgi:predicted  nucleic acid-binding Zn-ribbon protein